MRFQHGPAGIQRMAPDQDDLCPRQRGWDYSASLDFHGAEFR
jgi:hypothetical protein